MRDDARRTAPLTRRQPATGALAAVLVASLMLGTPSPGVAADPRAEARAEFLARLHGGAPADFELVYERTARLANGEQLVAAKFVDRRTGQMELVYRDSNGVLGGAELLTGRQRAAEAHQSALERKADRALRAAIVSPARARSGSRLPVAVWLAVDVTADEESVIERHPEVRWLDGRPLTNDLSLIRELRGELWTARRGTFARAAAALATGVRQLGGRVAYASTAAPLVFIDLPAPAVAALARRGDVLSLGLERRWQPAMNTAGRAVDANWTSGTADRGAGIRVAVVEYHNVRTGGDLSRRVARSHSTSGRLAYTGGGTFDHPTWVAGAVAGHGSGYLGVAPAARIVSSSTGGYLASLTYDRRIIAAADWAIAPAGGDADIVNTSLVQDTAAGSEEARRYFDSLVDQDGRLSISAAGNYVNFNGWQIGSPGTGYNVLTVGGVNDRGTAGHRDDRIWYVPGSNGSNWLDRPSDPWNRHGDYNKPNLVAPAVAVRTANGLAASGTSVATPIVSGVAAQLLANEPVLAAWPEGARAVLMAGAIYRVPMPNGSRNVDHEGVGMTSAYWTNLIARRGDNRFGGYQIDAMLPGEMVEQVISVRGGDRLRVALAWNSQTRGTRNLSKTDVLRADLDLRVTGPNGAVVGSYTIDNSYEFVEMRMPTTGVATIEVLQSRFDARSETYGLAWAKVRDSRPPAVSVRVPAGGEPWAVPSSSVRAIFDEPVLGTDNQSFTLSEASSGRTEHASVSYSSISRTATLRPDQTLAPGWYEARLTPGITDRAGNPLPATTWRFRVSRANPSAGGAVDQAAVLRAGNHVGYRFDTDGTVLGSKRISISAARAYEVDERRQQPGVPGAWLHLATGPLAEYWIRESPSAGLPGTIAKTSLDPVRPVILRTGTHVGRRFHGGSVSSSRSYRASSTVTVHADARAAINGVWRIRIDSGPLAGYWVTESGVAYLPGAVQLTDLRSRHATVGRGGKTAFRYSSSGKVLGAKTSSLSSARSTPMAAWAIINGRPSFYVIAGPWAAHWLGEISGVHLP
jgi:subtilase family protein/Big-like domain-containing protein